MNNLVIGASSQLAKYFPSHYEKISSREIDFSYLLSKQWDSVYICFAEQRTYLAKSMDRDVESLFRGVNVDLTIRTIQKLMKVSRRIVFYSTAELWNRCVGPIDVSMPFHCHENLYTNTKREISTLLKDKSQFPNISIVYPFNFNSVHRKGDYLFAKVFRSIATNTTIEIGDINYYRELLHPSMIVAESINEVYAIGEDYIVGSGRIVHVGDFIQKLYLHFEMDFHSMVKVDSKHPSIYRQNIFYYSTQNKEFFEDRLFDITVDELTSIMENKHG